ncbi:MAG: glycosyltransferase family 4 protein [Eubacterium sp.]|nr:glycosyltransferase family 4 protein [Eubacterium sp.]
MSKRLLITSTDLMMVQFLIPHVIYLSENGFEVEIACSDVGGRMDEIREKLKGVVKDIHIVRLVRSPASPTNFKGYGDMKKVINRGNYDVIWTNEPVMGVTTRLAARKARKKGTKVIYMVHGFHFYEGAPKVNWMMFYPIEKFAGHFCDNVVTMNLEDFNRAKKMKLPDVKYIHGIGMNPYRLSEGEVKNDIRSELGIREDAPIVLSIGELSKRKNQKTIVSAMAMMKKKDVHYLLCGKGDQLENLTNQAKELGIDSRVHFLGYRTDVVDICKQANVFVMPSLHEGLPVAALESMYSGVPMVVAKIRGLVDIIVDGKNGFLCHPDDSERFAEKIECLLNDSELSNKMVEQNKEIVVPFCIQSTKKEVWDLMDDLANN